MGKSGERGHEGEPGIKVPIVVTLLILTAAFGPKYIYIFKSL